MKKILVTGGAGFVGSNLCEYLLKKGHEVICVDNFYSSTKDNIKNLLGNPNFRFIKHDVINPLDIKVDEIYHLACPASPISYQFDPVYTVKINILGSLNMLELAKKTGARILQASTSEIYGDPLEHPQKETYWGNVDTLSPRACYDEGKRAAETLFSDYANEHGVDIRIIRIFNTYGPKMALNDGRVISNFIIQALRGEDISIYGSGNQTRSFMFVDDLLEGMVKMMENDDFQGPVNLGNPGEVSVKDLAEKIIKITGSKSKIVKLPSLKNDPQKRLPEISLAKQKLNWEPKVGFDDGLLKTVDYFEGQLKKKTNVLVFSTVYFPSLEVMDAAEERLRILIREMSYFHFHIITTRADKKLPEFYGEENFSIYRVGMGNFLDKYVLVLFAPFKALKMHKNKKFALVSSVRATYASLASLIFKIFTKTPFIVMMHSGDLVPSALKKAKFVWPIYKLVFKESAVVHLPEDAIFNQLRQVQKKSVVDLLSIESTPEIRAMKDIFHRIIYEKNKKLFKPR